MLQLITEEKIKYTNKTNPNLTPIGVRFGFVLFGAGKRT